VLRVGVVTIGLISIIGCGGSFEPTHRALSSVTSTGGAPVIQASVQILQPVAQLNTKGAIRLTGSCADGLKVSIYGDVAAPLEADCVSGRFSSDLVLVSPDGAKNIYVRQTNSQGQAASDQRAFVRDTTAPAVSFSAPAQNASVSSQGGVQGACDSGVPVEIAGSGLQAAVNAACVASAFNAVVVFTNGAGAKQITVSQTDAAGNSSTAAR
jgi:hypothetical protein